MLLEAELRRPRGLARIWPKPAPRVPVRVERAGDVGPRYHLHQAPPLVPRWRQTLLLHLQVDAASVEQQRSDILHQPFLVETAQLITHGVTNAELLVSLFAGTDIGTGAFPTEQRRAQLYRITRDGTTTQQISAATFDATLPLNTLIRDVPTRLNLVALNAGAATATVTVALHVLFFAEEQHRAHPPQPHCGCTGNPRYDG